MLTLITKIEYNELAYGGSKTINNKIVGKRISSVPALEAEMTLDRESSPTWILNRTQGAAFSQDLLAITDETFPYNVKFLHIQCHQLTESVGDVPQPLRFTLAIDGVSMGSMTQYQIANVDGFVPANITVSNVVVPTDKRAVLTAIIGIDN